MRHPAQIRMARQIHIVVRTRPLPEFAAQRLGKTAQGQQHRQAHRQQHAEQHPEEQHPRHRHQRQPGIPAHAQRREHRPERQLVQQDADDHCRQHRNGQKRQPRAQPQQHDGDGHSGTHAGELAAPARRVVGRRGGKPRPDGQPLHQAACHVRHPERQHLAARMHLVPILQGQRAHGPPGFGKQNHQQRRCQLRRAHPGGPVQVGPRQMHAFQIDHAHQGHPLRTERQRHPGGHAQQQHPQRRLKPAPAPPQPVQAEPAGQRRAAQCHAGAVGRGEVHAQLPQHLEHASALHRKPQQMRNLPHDDGEGQRPREPPQHGPRDEGGQKIRPQQPGQHKQAPRHAHQSIAARSAVGRHHGSKDGRCR